MENYVIINTDENDFLKDPFDDTSLIKLEAIKIDKNFNELDRFFEYIKPKKELSKEIEDITGITNTMLKEKGISLKEALEKFLDFKKDSSWIIGYYADWDMSLVVKRIYETKIEDNNIMNFISLRDYIECKTDLRKKVKSLKFDNVANYYNIKYNDLEKEWLDITISLLKILVKKENVETIEDFKEKNIPKFLFQGLSKRSTQETLFERYPACKDLYSIRIPVLLEKKGSIKKKKKIEISKSNIKGQQEEKQLSKRSTKVKVRFHHGKDEFAIRNIEFIDKTPDRKVSYVTAYNAINRYETTFYELILFRKWGAQIIDDFIYINDNNIDYIDFYFIRKDIKDKELLESLKNNISCLDKCERNLRYDGTLKELKEHCKELGKDNLNKIIEHIKIKKRKK